MKHIQVFFLLTTFAFAASAQNVGIGAPIPSDQLHTTGTVRFENYKGANTRIVQMDATGRLVVTPAGALFLNNTAQAVPDNGCGAGNGITSNINVTGQPSLVSSSKIAVRINITHTYDADLRIYLYPPTGVGVLVLAADNGGSGDNFSNTLFTDQAPVSITTGTAPFTGQYRPKGGAVECFASGTPLATFGDIGSGTIIPNGSWALRILDKGMGDIGTLNSWSISFTGPESYITANESDYIPKFSAGNLIPSNIYQQPSGINAGNIGIGIINPTVKLEINGAIKIGEASTSSKGSIKYSLADSSFRAYDNTQWKSMINNFDVVGPYTNGTAPYFQSMVRGAYVNLPALTFTIKKSGNYLVILSADGGGVQEKNNLYNLSDDRTDFEGELRVSPNNVPAEKYMIKKFFYTHLDNNGSSGQDQTTNYHSDDGDKSFIQYFAAGEIIQVYAQIQQSVGANAPPQQNPWYIYAQVKYILLN